MTSLTDLVISEAYVDDAPSAEEKVHAAQLDSDHAAILAWINDELLPCLARVIRDDDTLVDELVRLRNLHPEISAVLASASGWKPVVAVACATTANITLSGEQTIDGVLTSTSRVLVKNQSAAAANGIYVSAAGAWARASDADSAAELGYAFVPVAAGTANANTAWVCTQEADEITLATTSLTWTQVGLRGATGPTGPQGEQAIVWRGEWITTTAYAINDAVYSDGAAYICTVAHTSAALTEPGVGADWEDDWDLMADNAIVSGATETFVAGVDFDPGVDDSLTLAEDPGDVVNTWVHMGAALQHEDTYTIVGTTLTFDAVIPVDVTRIQVKKFKARTSTVIAALSVTEPKLAALAVSRRTIALGAVGDDQLDAAYLAAAPQRGHNFLVDGSMMLGGGADKAFAAGDPFAYGKADHWKGALTVSGTATLSRSITSAFGRTGRSLKWTVTSAGDGVLTCRSYIEAIDAAGMKNQTVTLSLRAGHDAGVAKNFTANVYKANAVDNFSAVTAIRSGTPAAVASATDTLIAERAIAMGDCTNGVMVEVVIASGIVTAKHFEIADVVLQLGLIETEPPFERFADVEARGAWYFEKITGDPNSGGLQVEVGQGVCTGTTSALFFLNYRPKRGLVTTTVFVRNGFSVVDYLGTTVQTSGGTGSAAYSQRGRNGMNLSVSVAAGLTAGRAAWLQTRATEGGYITVDARF